MKRGEFCRRITVLGVWFGLVGLGFALGLGLGLGLMLVLGFTDRECVELHVGFPTRRHGQKLIWTKAGKHTHLQTKV